MNTFGNVFRITSFGESHGEAIGGIIDGMPAGMAIDLELVQKELDRRKPGQSEIVSSRKESDRVRILSGIFDGKTTGTPIGFAIENKDQRLSDYSDLKDKFRPSHADFTYTTKYGIRDYRGGGRSSARETAVRVVAGAFAKQALAGFGIRIKAFTSQIGNVRLENDYTHYDLNAAESNIVRCPDSETAERMRQTILQARSEGDTVGGIVSCVIKGVPPGLGEPVFDKLQARLGYAMLGINAAKGFEYGMGFDGCSRKGSEMNDMFLTKDGNISTVTNHSGGIQGGISNGQDIYFRVAFKPVATLLKEMETIDQLGNKASIHAKGRHDPCVLPRAVPIVEAMAAIVVFDMMLLNRCARIYG